VRSMFGSEKWLMAGLDRLLIDDADHNIDKFVQYGGHTLLVPRPWNHAHAQSRLAGATIIGALEKLC